MLLAGDVTPLPADLLTSGGAEGDAPPPLVEVSAQFTKGSLGTAGAIPLDRLPVTSANPGETVLLEVYAKDIKDSYVEPKIDDYYGVFAVYLDAVYNAETFTIPAGTSVNPKAVFPIPVSYRNPYHRTEFADGVISTDMHNFSNGPSLISQPGELDEVGGFTVRDTPYGKTLTDVPTDQREKFLNLHVFDVPFVVQSLYVTDDLATVATGVATKLRVLDNDGLVQGPQTVTLNGADQPGHQILTWTSNAAGAGPWAATWCRRSRSTSWMPRSMCRVAAGISRSIRHPARG